MDKEAIRTFPRLLGLNTEDQRITYRYMNTPFTVELICHREGQPFTEIRLYCLLRDRGVISPPPWANTREALLSLISPSFTSVQSLYFQLLEIRLGQSLLQPLLQPSSSCYPAYYHQNISHARKLDDTAKMGYQSLLSALILLVLGKTSLETTERCPY